MIRALARRFGRSKISRPAHDGPMIEALEDRVLMAHHRTPFLVQTNLVSDVAGRAAKVDANLVNAWGIAAGGQSPFWVNANGTGAGSTPPLYAPQTITIPAASGTGTGNPTGIVFNNTTGFTITNNGSTGAAAYIFASEDGSISAWRPPAASPTAVTSSAVTMIDNSAAGAVYKGLALGTFGASPAIFAANFHAGTIDVFNSSFQPIAPTSAFSFKDSRIPSSYAPFNIVKFGPNLLVTFAKRDAAGHDDVPGIHHGYVDLFTTGGVLLRHFAAGGTLNSPWGVAVAPHAFGRFADDVLIGNFGDGRISAFDQRGRFQGLLTNSAGTPIAIDGLWGLQFGNGQNAGNTNTLYFAAGPDNETHGLFGSIDFQLRRRRF